MTFSVWAPHATRSVTLELDDRSHPLEHDADGWWRTALPGSPGARYAFRIDDGPERPDPRSLFQPDGPHDRSQVVDLAAHTWQDDDWGGVALADCVIYELHLGTFTPEGTCDAAIGRLDHLTRLGVTMVEIMPVAAFPGARGWGYDSVCPYAVHATYGGPAALQRLVDACHARGLGVCLDVVYNHLGPSGNYLKDFGPYFTDRYTTPWGEAVNLDGPGSDQVRGYLLDNARMWFRDFHLDALRLDAVHALHDERALTFLEELATETDALTRHLGRPLLLIAESDRNDPATITPRSAGGTGLHAQWADDLHHSLHTLLTGESQGYYADFADSDAISKTWSTPFFHDGTWSSFRGRHHGRPIDPTATSGHRFVASLQTHDQVGNRAQGERLSQLIGVDRLACAAAMLLAGPYVPMLFMGEEWAASTPWLYFTDHQEPDLAAAVSQGRRSEFADHGWSGPVPDPQDPSTFARSRLDWDEVQRLDHAALLDWYRRLIRLRRRIPDLHDGDLTRTAARFDGDVLHLVRGRHTVLVNLSDRPTTIDVAESEILAHWRADVVDGTARLPTNSVVILCPKEGGRS